MNPLIWFFSVKHTGTHFTFEYLSRMGLSQVRMDVLNGVFQSPGDYVHLHIEEPNHLPLMRYQHGDPCFVTLRNPIDVHISWLARYGLAKSTTQALVTAFDKLGEVIDKLNPHIFRVDAEDREAEVNALAAYLGSGYKYEYVDHTEHRGHRGKRHNFPGAYEYEVPLSVKGLALHFGYQPPTGENNADSDVCERDTVQRQYG